MTVTQDVVRDLVPVYLAGEASADTRRLVEEYAARDPAIAREIASARESTPGLPPTPPLAPTAEKAALDATRQLIKTRTSTLVVAIVLSLLPCLLQLLHVLVQPVEALAPEPLEAAHPLVDRPQPAGVQAVQPLLARPADPHQPDLPEDPQVLGRLRLSHPQIPRQVGHRPLAGPQQHQDLPPQRFGDRVERVRGCRRSCHGAIICLYRNV